MVSLSLDQRAFDFLKNDPACIEGLRHERAVRDVVNRRTPLLDEIQKGIARHVRDIAKDAHLELSSEVRTLHEATGNLTQHILEAGPGQLVEIHRRGRRGPVTDSFLSRRQPNTPDSSLRPTLRHQIRPEMRRGGLTANATPKKDI